MRSLPPAEASGGAVFAPAAVSDVYGPAGVGTLAESGVGAEADRGLSRPSCAEAIRHKRNVAGQVPGTSRVFEEQAISEGGFVEASDLAGIGRPLR